MSNFLNFLKGTKTQAFLAYLITTGGLGLIGFAGLPDNDRNRIFDIVLLTATFYFGSSKSGATKDETIASMASGTGNNPTTVNAPDNSGGIKA